jgi:hypothetical protein
MNEGVCGWAPVPVLTGNRMKLGFSPFRSSKTKIWSTFFPLRPHAPLSIPAVRSCEISPPLPPLSGPLPPMTPRPNPRPHPPLPYRSLLLPCRRPLTGSMPPPPLRPHPPPLHRTSAALHRVSPSPPQEDDCVSQAEVVAITNASPPWAGLDGGSSSPILRSHLLHLSPPSSNPPTDPTCRE